MSALSRPRRSSDGTHLRKIALTIALVAWLFSGATANSANANSTTPTGTTASSATAPTAATAASTIPSATVPGATAPSATPPGTTPSHVTTAGITTPGVTTPSVTTPSITTPSNATAAVAFSQANQAYNNGDYAGAVRGYRALLTQHGYSVAVLFNLGNAWARLNQPGRAILSYERALWLAPADRTIAANLRLVQQEAAIPMEHPTALDRNLGLVSLDALAWIGMAAMLTLVLAALVARSGLFKAVWVRRSVVALSALVLVATGGGMLRKWSDLDRAVVLADAAAVRIAPAVTADVSFLLKPGSLVRAGERYEDYLKVHAGDGRSGWVSAQQVVKIVPSAHQSAIDDWSAPF